LTINPREKNMTSIALKASSLALGLSLMAFGTAASANAPGSDGPNRVCSYTSGLSDRGYASARVSYPCGLPNASYAATTLTGGFTNTKEDMYWLADHLTSHGYIVI